VDSEAKRCFQRQREKGMWSGERSELRRFMESDFDNQKTQEKALKYFFQ
jgi:hypothetical protein